MLVCLKCTKNNYEILNTETEEVSNYSQSSVDELFQKAGKTILGLVNERGSDLRMHLSPSNMMFDRGSSHYLEIFHRDNSVTIIKGKSNGVNSFALYVCDAKQLVGVVDNIYQRAKYNFSRVYKSEYGNTFYLLELKVKTGDGRKVRSILFDMSKHALPAFEQYMHKSEWVVRENFEEPFPLKSKILNTVIKIYGVSVKLPRHS